MDIKTHIAQRIENAKKAYLSDLDAATHEFLSKSPGGKARTPYDMTYEVAQVNELFASRMSGGDFDVNFPEDGWITAPPEFCNKETCIAEFTRTIDACLNAWNAVSEDKISVSQPGPRGEWTCLGLASMCATHTMYHDAQINYLQAMEGDEAVHWN